MKQRSDSMRVNKSLAAMAALLWLASTPVAAQVFSWNPLKDVQDVLPEGTPSESKIIAGGTTGKGMVINRRTSRQTFMKMIQLQGSSRMAT
jgi:hypothetical protein